MSKTYGAQGILIFDHSPATGVRYWYMDTLRAYLMLGGVFFHAALVYAVNSEWRVRDPGDRFFFDVVAGLLTSFRMPAFFLIAGFFCSFLFLRDAHATVVRRRMVALCLPFVAMALSLQFPQYILKLVYMHQFPPADWWVVVLDYFTTGAFISHLWFLLNLIIYYLAAGALLSNSRFCRIADNLLNQPFLLVLVGSKLSWALCSCGMILLINRTIGSIGIGNAYDIDTIFRYLPFFVAGAIIFLRPALFSALLSTSIVDWLAFVVIAYAKYFSPVSGRMATIVEELAFYFFGFMITIVLVRFSRKYMNRRTETQQKLVDAAFSIYLFHHICVVSVSMFLLEFAPTLNVFLKYAIVVSIGCLVPYAFHANVIRRFPKFRLLFNGRTKTSSA